MALKKYIEALAVMILVAANLAHGNAAAQNISMIRDAEIENNIRALSTPLFVAAGLEPSAVSILLVNDPTLNAFVAGGMNIFINTGLIMRTVSAEQLAGVIAHETGHIAGGHLARTPGALKNASTPGFLGYLLGGAAAIAGRPDVGFVLAQGGIHIGTRSFLKFSRTQESSADQAAVRYLDQAGISPRGMLEFLDMLGDQDLLSASRQEAYAQTHPMSRARVDFIADYVKKSAFSDTKVPRAVAERHERMRAKLFAFINPPSRTLRKFRKSDNSVTARYARAIAYFRRPNLDRSLELMNGLIAEEPKNPYFYEQKGQILFESGRGREALAPYETAVNLLPDSPLLRTSLAQVQLERNDRALIAPAIANLKVSLEIEPTNSFSWHQLAIAYGRANRLGFSALALAEEAYRQRRMKDARLQAGRAEKLLNKGTPEWLRAQDIKESTAETK